jgi:hypothetical protein
MRRILCRRPARLPDGGQSATLEPDQGRDQAGQLSGDLRFSLEFDATVCGSFEDSVIEGEHPKYRTIYFKPRNCNDQSGRTLHSFTAEQKKNLDLPRAE